MDPNQMWEKIIEDFCVNASQSSVTPLDESCFANWDPNAEIFDDMPQLIHSPARDQIENSSVAHPHTPPSSPEPSNQQPELFPSIDDLESKVQKLETE